MASLLLRPSPGGARSTCTSRFARASSLLAGLLALVPAGCGGGGSGGGTTPPSQTAPELTFLWPADGSVLGTATLVVKVAFDPALVPATLELRLDGAKQAAGFVLQGGVASAQLAGLSAGEHVLAVQGAASDGTTGGAEVDFRVVLGGTPLLQLAKGGYDHGYFGQAVGAPGDVNGDGRGDVAVGAPGTHTIGANTGRVVVVSGLDGSVIFEHFGTAGSEHLGVAVAGAGDVNKDGIPDVIAGAPGWQGDVGAAFVYSGADGSVLWTLVPDDELGSGFGIAVDGAGDADGDGYADLVIGGNASDLNGDFSGRLWVFRGVDGNLLHDVRGENPGDQLGVGVSNAGDVNGDGYDDFMGGAWGEDWDGPSSGSVRIYSGFDGTLIRRIDSKSANAHLGFSIDLAGDVDGDGVPDHVLGMSDEPTFGFRAGAVIVVSGADGSEIHRLYGAGDSELFGIAVSGIGDIDGDGRADFLVGSLGTTGPNGQIGSVFAYSGASGALLFEIRGQTLPSFFGIAVRGIGDVDGDHVPDIAAGAPFASPSGVPLAGGVYVHAGTLVPLALASAEPFVSAGADAELVLSPGTAWAGAPWRLELAGAPGDALTAVATQGRLDANGAAHIALRASESAGDGAVAVRAWIGEPGFELGTNTVLVRIEP